MSDFILSGMDKIKDKVKYLLEFNDVFKDDDNKLIARIWKSEISEVETKGAVDLLKLFGSGKLTSPEAIRRSRQKLQEHNPRLRGDLWDSRHTKGKIVTGMIKNYKV